MATTEPRLAPPVPHLEPRTEFAVLARALHRIGYDDDLAGHITCAQPDGTLLVNPLELGWDELRPSDVMRMDREGRVLEGPWTVSPATELHLALHRLRPGCSVAVHNHPRWGTVWAGAGRIPPVHDQNSALLPRIVLYDEYAGGVDDAVNAEAAIRGLDGADVALLAHHGVFVLGASAAQAYQRALTLERRSRVAWAVEALQNDVERASMSLSGTDDMLAAIDEIYAPLVWGAAVRRELRAEPGLVEGE